METRPFKSEDMDTINGWYEAHGMPTVDFVPPTGYVAFDDLSSVAAGFLIHTDSKLAIFEGLVTNKARSSDDRNLALGILFDTLESDVRRSGARKLIFWYNDADVSRRAEQKGARLLGTFRICGKEII